MRIKVITPERTVLDAQDVQHVLLPGEGGQLGILPRHVSMVSSLAMGRISVDLSGESLDIATTGGFAEVFQNRVTVLVDTAEKVSEIDVERARQARKRAQERLRRRAEEIDEARALAALARAANRLRVAGVE
ncbi:MAG: F0F1 ATP synthase subunit epsilon [Planctomycetes bacterium]|nr:F0F1 ATP synthase subunit epsilon [Planctomycetota bacterium]